MKTKEAIEFVKNRHRYRLNKGSAFDISKMNEAVDLIVRVAEKRFRAKTLPKEGD